MMVVMPINGFSRLGIARSDDVGDHVDVGMNDDVDIGLMMMMLV